MTKININVPSKTIIFPMSETANYENHTEMIREAFREYGARACHSAPMIIGVDKYGNGLVLKSRSDLGVGTVLVNPNFVCEGVVLEDTGWNELPLPFEALVVTTWLNLEDSTLEEVAKACASRDPKKFRDAKIVVAVDPNQTAFIVASDGTCPAVNTVIKNVRIVPMK